MEHSPPFGNAPIFSPGVYASTTSSPSRSPNRYSRNFSRSIDPLLRDLSPSTTLRAFASASNATAGDSSDQLVRSIEAASASERVVGARIAQTCSDIRAWFAEVKAWEWPGTFEPPPDDKREAIGARMLEKHYHTKQNEDSQVSQWHDKDGLEFVGSLPLDMVASYEQRVEDIRNALEDLHVEELKTHILHVHTPQNSRQATYDVTAHCDGMAANVQRLDDFTALITATILQALPFLSRLYKLLEIWAARLAVLQKLPAFLEELSLVKQQIEAGWSSMAQDLQNSDIDTSDLRAIFDKTHARLGRRVTKLGAKLDSLLDDLEGREDTIPDTWIDAFEALEASYGEWVLSSQREIMAREFDLLATFKYEDHESETNTRLTIPMLTSSPPEPALSSPAQNVHEASAFDTATEQYDVGLGINFSDSIHGGNVEVSPSQDPATPLKNSKLLEDAESPVLGSRALHSRDEESSTNSDMDRSSASTPAFSDGPSNEKEIVQQKRRTLSFRTRHIPIITGYEENEAAVVSRSPVKTRARDDHVSSSMTALPVMDEHTSQHIDGSRSVSSPILEDMPARPSSDNVRARAAFLNGGLEERQRLQKAKAAAPVRSFEHASSAFTKLFNRANSGQLSRSNSGSSKSSSTRRGLDIGTRSGSGRLNDRSDTSLSSLRSASAPFKPDSPAVAELDSVPDRLQGLAQNSVAARFRKENRFMTPDTQYGFEPLTGDSRSTIESVWDSPDPDPFPDNWPLPAQLDEVKTIDAIKTIGTGAFEPHLVDSSPMSLDGYVVQSNPEGMGASPTSMADHTRQSRSTHSFFPRIAHRGTPSRNASGSSQTFSVPAATPLPMSPTTHTSTVITSRPSEVGHRVPHDQEVHGEAIQASTASTESFRRSSVNIVDIRDPLRRLTSSSRGQTPPTSSLPSDEGYRSEQRGPVQEEHAIGYSPTTEKQPSHPRGPSPTLAVNKRRQDLIVETGPFGSNGGPSSNSTPTKKSHHKKTSSTGQFDRQVSRVISSLPTQIRFTSGTADSHMNPEPSKTMNSSNAGSLRNRQAPLAKSSPRTPSSSGLTLSPAKMDDITRKSRSSSDPDVKLYHLSQEGERQPIKLYVRLVGENERVMVRVGGGWADLGEYLRQYAEHHGHRTVSEGTRIEIAAAASSSNSSVEKRPTTSSAAKRSAPRSRPTSVQGHRPLSRLSMSTRPDSPSMVFAMDNHHHNSTPSRPSTAGTTTSNTSSDDNAHRRNRSIQHQQHTPPATLTLSLTPRLTNPRPSTANANASNAASLSPFPAPSSSSPQAPSSLWSGREIGLAGPVAGSSPRVRRGTVGSPRDHTPATPDLADHKARWVEEMIARAKDASAGAKSGSAGQKTNGKGRNGTVTGGGDGSAGSPGMSSQGWSSLGRVGGTRRVMMKKNGEA